MPISLYTKERIVRQLAKSQQLAYLLSSSSPERLNDDSERRASRFLENAMEEDRVERERRGKEEGRMGHCLERVCARCDMRVWPLCDVTSAAPSLLQNRYTIALVFSFPLLRLSLSLSLPVLFSPFLSLADSSIGKGQRSMYARERKSRCNSPLLAWAVFQRFGD